MSLIKASTGLFENYTFVARPQREFSSSSSGVTGSVRLFPQASTSEKLDPSKSINVISGTGGVVPFNDSGLALTLARIESLSSPNLEDQLNSYMNGVNAFASDPRQLKTLGILRSTPPLFITSLNDISTGTFEFNTIRKNLFPYYRASYPSAYWGYSNYLCINFLSGGNFQSNAALIYANPTDLNGNAILSPSGSFTLETYIKPTCRISGSYHAGTIFHVSSSFALSIVSGSKVDAFGKPDSFRIMLQLSHSANILPSEVDLSVENNQRSYPQDLIFLSEDKITFNGWHHLAVRWGGSSVDFGTGSFFIDGIRSSNFSIPSESVTRTDYLPENSNALFVGNYYEGENNSSNAIRGFFDKSEDEGFTSPFSSTPAFPTFAMRHQLGAEIHETRFWNEYRSYEQILSGTFSGYQVSGSNQLFSLGPHFIHESPDRNVLLTPFREVSSSSINTPFARQLSLGFGGHLINTENHLRDLVSGYYPRHLNMTASVAASADAGMSVNDILFATASISRKNLLILPCDNGKFVPRWLNLVTSSLDASHYRFGNTSFVDASFVDASNLSTGSGTITRSSVLEDDLLDRAKIILSHYSSIPSQYDNKFFVLISTSGIEIRFTFKNDGVDLTGTANDTGEIVTIQIQGLASSNLIAEETLKAINLSSLSKTLFFSSRSTSDVTITQLRGGPAGNQLIRTNLFPAFAAFTSGNKFKGGDNVGLEIDTTTFTGNLASELPAFVLTANNSSYLTTLFDASNLFYGSKIHPGTFEITDPSFTGSSGLVSIRLRDNGMGGLYRADSTTPHAKWNSVGTLLYEEGLAVVTSPYLGDLYGKDSFSVKFRGEQPVNVLSTNVTVPAFQINSSSLPSYLPLTASNYSNEEGNPVTWITRVNLHDENLNIIGRTELAQPIAKRTTDKFVIKVKFDF